jgi:hypothetical protein
LRSSPTPEGRCYLVVLPALLDLRQDVAILTDPGGLSEENPGFAYAFGRRCREITCHQLKID